MIVDPIMGDHGEAYANLHRVYVQNERTTEMADILTPNLYRSLYFKSKVSHKNAWSRKEIEDLGEELWYGGLPVWWSQEYEKESIW